MYDNKYFVPAGEERNLSESEVKAFWKTHTRTENTCTWRNFDSFVITESKMWFIEINEYNWKLGKYSCSHFIKNFMCKHLIAISATQRLNGCIIPLQAKLIP